jgi:hypothetical protein
MVRTINNSCTLSTISNIRTCQTTLIKLVRSEDFSPQHFAD